MDEKLLNTTAYLKRLFLICLLAGACYSSGTAAAAYDLPKSPASPEGNVAQGKFSQPSEPFVIPFRYDPLVLPSIIIEMSINGSEPLPFILDTGYSGSLIIGEQEAKRYNIKSGKKTVKLNPGGQIVRYIDAPLRTAFTGKEQNYIVSIHNAVVAPISMPKDFLGAFNVSGVLGAEFFYQYGLVVTIDFDSKTLLLYKQSNSPLRNRSKGIIFLKENKGAFFVPVRFSGTKTVEALLDTGCDHVSIRADYLEGLVYRGGPKSETIDSAGEAAKVSVIRTTVAIGDKVEPDFRVLVTSSKSEQSSLGVPFLRRYRTTIDVRNKKMLLEERTIKEKPSVPGAPMFSLVQKGSSLYVANFKANQSTTGVNIQNGDEILSVDTVVISDLPLVAAQRFVNGFAGTEAVLVLRRSGRTFEINYKRPSPFEMT